jgi:SAM-dependent methyltransferase
VTDQGRKLRLRSPWSYARIAVHRLIWRLTNLTGDAALGVRTRGFSHRPTDAAREFYGYWAVAYATLCDVGARMTTDGVAARRFVDVGCGLGRPLYYFAGRFDELIGYEVSPERAAQAQVLLREAQARREAFAKVRIVQADAAQVLPIDKPMAVFLYNPFGAGPMRALVERILSCPHPVHIYYVNPVHSRLIADGLGQRPAKVASFIPFHVYRYEGRAQAGSAPPDPEGAGSIR